jgi:urease accessory protein
MTGGITLPPARTLRRGPLEVPPHDMVMLDYEGRMLRRRRLVTLHEEAFLVDLPETVSVNEGDAFVLEDGRLIAVLAAEEPLMEVQGDLHRLAWHIGNRHAPCQIELDRLVIRQDRVLREMLLGLGAVVKDIVAPFTPEGGAYGHGRTLGHGDAAKSGGGAGHGAHDHSYGHTHDHGHHHDHDHDH